MPIRIIYIYLLFSLSLAGSLFTTFRLNGYSVAGLFTLSAVIIPFFLIKSEVSKQNLLVITPLFLYCLYDIFGFFWGPIEKNVIQNATVWTGMLMLLLISTVPRIDTSKMIFKILDFAKYPFGLYLLYFFINQIDSQATMMISLLFFSYFLSKLINKSIKKIEILFMLFLFIVPIVTGSRIIYIAQIILFFIIIFVYYRHKNPIKTITYKILLLFFSVLIIFIASITFADRINETMIKGDNAKVGGVTINTSGRAVMWEIVYNSAKKNIVLGNGQDGPSIMLNNPQWAHPHNDYLRLLHHNGIVGLTLWLTFLFTILFILIKNIRKTQSHHNKTFYLFNLSYLLVIFILMLTDNPIVYSYIMYPFIIISGSSLILINRGKNVLQFN